MQPCIYRMLKAEYNDASIYCLKKDYIVIVLASLIPFIKYIHISFCFMATTTTMMMIIRIICIIQLILVALLLWNKKKNMTKPTILKHKINDGATNNFQLWRVTFNCLVTHLVIKSFFSELWCCFFFVQFRLLVDAKYFALFCIWARLVLIIDLPAVCFD